jgi:BsuBI/PstI restriction endonuclease domain/BsuBI/PstI restriction endonuclease HTH domain
MLPDLLDWDSVHKRLGLIFPEGTPHRNYCTRELAASTVFTALYVGAVEGGEVFFGPKHVYRMTDKQADRTDGASRNRYAHKISSAGFQPTGRRWYSDNTREPIRDETLREGLVALGAVIEKIDVPTTSSKPRYALARGFAALFAPQLKGKAFDAAISAWQASALNPGALARIALVRKGAAAGGSSVLVTFPNGETRRMVVGPSTDITKAIIEVFAPKFLQEPAVLFVSESGNKVVARDDDLARAIGLNIKADKNLPDTILVDLGPKHPLLVFVEAVATDGPVNDRRKKALEDLATEAGFPLQHIAYVTAYLDRSGAPFKKTVDALAWGSYAWFVSEPDGLIELKTGKGLSS